MMGNRGDASLGHHFGHGQPKRHVHWNGENILRDQQLEFESFDKLVDARFQLLLHLVNAIGDLARAGRYAKELLAPREWRDKKRQMDPGGSARQVCRAGLPSKNTSLPPLLRFAPTWPPRALRHRCHENGLK